MEMVFLRSVFHQLPETEKDPTLTVYLAEGNCARPGILVCPGGGYSYCSDREAAPVAEKLLPMGYNVFVLDYAVEPDRFPNQILQVAAAMELIHANAEKWNTDLDRIAILGFSAGGHLACHYTNAFDCPEVREIFPDSKPVQASILCYPVITTREAYCHKGSFENLSGRKAPFEDRFSCEKLVNDKTPPTFIWHTAPDKTVPVFNSLLYAQALSEKKIPYSLHIYPYGGHGLSTVEPEINPNLPAGAELAKRWLTDLELWLKEIFK